jgi:hypothetical protein
MYERATTVGPHAKAETNFGVRRILGAQRRSTFLGSSVMKSPSSRNVACFSVSAALSC